jgi:hypothetical protein
VLERLWQRLGIGEVIAELVGRRKFGFAVERALFAMVANRACAPASKLYCYEQWLGEDVRIAGAEALGLHHFYRAMDFLNANKEPIEQAVYFRMADLLGRAPPPCPCGADGARLVARARGRAGLRRYLAQHPR